MHQNVSLRYVGFERSTPLPPVSFFAGRPSLSITPRVHESRSSTLSPQQPCSAQPNPPRLPACQSEKLTDFFSLRLQVRNPTLFCHSERGRNMTGVHGNNICADVSSSLKISEDLVFIYLFLGEERVLRSKVIFHRAAIPFWGGKVRIATIIWLNMRPSGG